MKLTIAICTWNRASMLRSSLAALRLAVSEAANRVDQYNEPTALLEVWLTNGAKWKRMMSLYIPFEAAIRAAIRSATSAEEIQTIRNGLEIALKQLFGL